MKLLNFNIINLTFFYIIGILIAYLYQPPVTYCYILCAVSFVLLTLQFIRSRNTFVKSIWFGIFSYLSILCIGFVSMGISNPKNAINYFENYTNTDTSNAIVLNIREVLKPSTYAKKYIAKVIQTNSKKSVGEVLLNIKKDTLHNDFNVDDTLFYYGPIASLANAQNPGGFNYKQYLNKNHIFSQIQTEHAALSLSPIKSTSVLGVANYIRNYINLKLKSQHLSPSVLAIINALFLGQRQDISQDLLNNYTNAGAIHILAISGLHVGIILMLLSFIFKPLNTFKHGKILKTIILIVLLWCFAIISGLSASVTRAVTMFSILCIAQNLNRPTNIYNTLCLSAFILLLIKPNFIFDVGFQLSYMAVLAIVTLDSHLYKCLSFKNKVLDFYWHTASVTITAQIGILPLSLYYFHQFPGLFFITNIVLVPLLGGILGIGLITLLCVICFPSGFLITALLSTCLSKIISLMNAFVSWIANHETFIFKHIPFNMCLLISSYVFLFSMVCFLIYKNFKTAFGVLLSVILMQCAIIYSITLNSENQFVIFNSKSTLIAKNQDRTIHFASSNTSEFPQLISQYATSVFAKHITKQALPPIYRFQDKTILIVDSLGIYNVNGFKPNIVLLSHSPKINLNRLIDTLQPDLIIADANNYFTMVEQWKQICVNKKRPFYDIRKKGAFVLR